MPNELRPELPRPIPARILRRPLDRGYPVPWFVAYIDGTPDFRVIRPGGIATAWNHSLCWVCGDRLGAHKAFTVGPMCAVNRTSAEPPSHLDCADWSARACPFLSRPHAKRRDAGKPEDAIKPAGVMLERNPGVALVWVTRRPRVRRVPDGGVLFDIGDPEQVRWYAEGRPATREEVMKSIDSGLPALRALAEEEGEPGVRALDLYVKRAMALVPA